MSANALIVQNKGGGHGELGTYVMTCPSIHYSTWPNESDKNATALTHSLITLTNYNH